MNIGDTIEVDIFDDKKMMKLIGEVVDFIRGKKKQITHYIIQDKNGNRFIKAAN